MPEVIAPTQTVTPVQADVKAPEESLVTRASKVAIEPEKAPATNGDAIAFDPKAIQAIADPAQRKLVEDAYKSFQADYTRKTQDLASKRKELEAREAQPAKKSYTVNDIPSLLNDPTFVQAAQDYQRINGGQNTATQTSGNGELTAEEFSYLSPEQQKLYQKTIEVEKTNRAILSRLHSAEIVQEDTGLKSKYANYDPKSVDDIFNGMMNGSIQATREHLWKVTDYDSAVNRAYQLGLQDRKLGLVEKANASSQPNMISSTPSSGDVPVKAPNESQSDHWKRVAENAMRKVGVIK